MAGGFEERDTLHAIFSFVWFFRHLKLQPPLLSSSTKRPLMWPTFLDQKQFVIAFKGELNPEMKLCELLVLGHCIHLPLILFACASSGQSYNVGSPVPPNFCDVIDTAMTGDPIAFWSFLNFYRKVLFWSLQASSMFIFTLLRVSGKDLKS